MTRPLAPSSVAGGADERPCTEITIGRPHLRLPAHFPPGGRMFRGIRTLEREARLADEMLSLVPFAEDVVPLLSVDGNAPAAFAIERDSTTTSMPIRGKN